MIALYLDYDGVLHPECVYRHPKHGIYLAGKYAGHTLFEHCGLLADALDPYPEVRIVLSTSWVRVLGYSRALGHLNDRLRRRVVGATFHSERMSKENFAQLSRGQQVVADVGRRRPTDWLALDDDDEGWPADHRAKLLKTDRVYGIATALPELRSRLAGLVR